MDFDQHFEFSTLSGKYFCRVSTEQCVCGVDLRVLKCVLFKEA